MPKSSSPKRKRSPKRSGSKKPKRIVLCKESGKLYNPDSGRCVKKSGRVGNKLACPSRKVRNPKTGRCVKKSGRIGSKLGSVVSRLRAIVKSSRKRKSKASKSKVRKSPKSKVRKSKVRKSPKSKVRKSKKRVSKSA